jgi:deoxycytidine triphosphate deaminase
MLNKQQILDYCRQYNLVTGVSQEKIEKHVQPSSYDLTLGNEYYVHNERDGKRAITDNLGENENLCIPENGVCFIITEEKINMPTNLSGDLSLALGLIKKGIMISRQPPVDPGYSGKIVAMLHNLSNKDVHLKRGQHILTMVFHEIKQTEPYRGKYQNLDTLKLFVQEPVISALDFVSREVRSTRERFEKLIPWILTIISIMIAIASAFGLFNTTKQMLSPSTPNSMPNIGNTLRINNTDTSITVLSQKEIIIQLPHNKKHILINIDTGVVKEIK